MENWIIISKFTILIYCILKYTDSEMKSTNMVVLFMLLYVCINMASYIIKKDMLKKILRICSIILLTGCFQYLSVLFILLFPSSIYELAFMYSDNLRLWPLAAVIPLFLPDKGILPEYILVGLFSLLVYIISHKHFNRIQNLAKENDEMREKIHLLSRRLSKYIEYEAQMKYSSQLEERNKIAQEIHDRVGHAISGSLMQLEAARLLMDKDREKTGEIIKNVIIILREGMESIRATLKNIKPAAEQLGINRLKLMLDEFTMGSHIKAVLLHKGNLECISHIQWKVIHDNMGEALTNALKYSNASAITINIEVLNKFIKAEARDNGIGAYVIKKGLGISGMEERSGGLGGKVIVDGSKGFSVITLLPLEGEFYGNQTADS